MKHLKTYALILSLVGILHNTQAQEANKTSFSLQEAIDYSMKHSPNYMNAELDLKSAEYRKNEIRGLGLPQINGSIDIKDYINIPTSLLPAQIFGGPEGSFIPVKFGTKYNATAGLSASQLIFSSDYIFALKASKEFMNLSKITVTRSKSELVSQVSRAYYLVLVYRETEKLFEKNIERLKKLYADTKVSNEQGFVELIDVERIEVLYNNQITEKEKLEQNIVVLESALKFQMGYNINDPITLTEDLNSAIEYQELSTTKVDITQRPDYKQLQANQTLLDIDVKRLKWGYMPTLSAYGSYQFNAQRNEFNFANDKNDPSKQWFKVALVGATLNLNIFDGLQRHYKIQQAKVSAIKNQNSIKILQLGAEVETASASVAYNNAYKSMNSQKKNMGLAQHIVESTQKKYKEGVGPNMDVISAETTLKEAETNYITAVYNMIVAKIDYQKATGTLVK